MNTDQITSLMDPRVMDQSISIARGVMERLFTGGKNDQAKGAGKVFITLINARNATQNEYQR